MSRRRGSSDTEAWAKLAPGVQTGLTRLVSDNKDTLAAMLSAEDCSTQELCEKCAGVIRQQQLTPSSFLARFFDADMLREHAVIVGKSSKGSAPALAERVANAWARNVGPVSPVNRPKQQPKLLDRHLVEKQTEGIELAEPPPAKRAKRRSNVDKIIGLY